MRKLSFAVTILLIASTLILSACQATTPSPSPALATQPPPQAQPPQPPVKETVVVTVPVKETVVVPATAAPTVTPTLTPTPAPGQVKVATPTPAGKLEFTIEFAPSAPRKGDNKIQLTIILHIKGGSKPYKVQEDNIPQEVTPTSDGVQYVRDWHNCGPDEPHTITVISADGQQAKQSTMMSYKCP